RYRDGYVEGRVKHNQAGGIGPTFSHVDAVIIVDGCFGSAEPRPEFTGRVQSVAGTVHRDEVTRQCPKPCTGSTTLAHYRAAEARGEIKRNVNHREPTGQRVLGGRFQQ